ncbi:MAG: VOC family protein [Betaproteobacteria bacterium]
MLVQPYVFFEGRCEEALDFYAKAIDAKLEMKMKYSESPGGSGSRPSGLPAGSDDKIMHAAFKVGDSLVMASDGMCSGQAGFKGVALTISMDDQASVRRMFEALAQGGQVHMPLEKTFYSPLFGVVADKFGLSWMLMANPA